MYTSKRTEPFVTRMNGLKGKFDSCYGFLQSLAFDELAPFHLGTAKNAHLYYRDGYYAYIVIDDCEVELRQTLHTQKKRGTHDNHAALFGRPMEEMINRLSGFSRGWARKSDDGIILSNGTPREFFDELLALIQSAHAGRMLGTSAS